MNRQLRAPYRTLYQFFWPIIKPYWGWCMLMFQAPFISAFYYFLNNYAIKLLVDNFSNNHFSYHQVATPIIIFIVAQIALDIAWRTSDFAAQRIYPFLHRGILLKSYDYVQYHSYTYFQNHPSGTIISRLKGILEGFDNIYENLHHLMGKNFLTTLICILSLLVVNTSVFLFMVTWSIVVIVIMYPMSKKLNQLSSASTEEKHAIMGGFADNILNIYSLFYFAKRQFEFKQAKKKINKNYIPKLLKMQRYYFKLSLVGSVLYWFMLITVFLFMIWLRQHQQVSTGDFVYVMMMAITISMELWMFTYSMFEFMKQLGDLKSSFSILSKPHKPIDKPYAGEFVIKSPTIQFRKISFQYEHGKPIFKHLNLTIPAGQKIGIVGHSGAGKSTLVSLLLKNFLPNDGEILLDGKSLDEITADSIRSQIALIPQDILLFHRSIAENIGYATDKATYKDIKHAAQLANIDDFIEALPDKYETLVGERGIKLSGGQRQRIAIARAILKQAPIIILDEATSSLDTVTEQQIQSSINQLLDNKNTTVIAIAHRLSTIRHMDRIVVMDGGQILEDGHFEELMMKEQGHFKSLWDSQINGMIL